MFRWLFGCPHEKWTNPFTIGGLTYRVCLECGANRKYDLARMRFVEFDRGEERKLQAPNYGQGVIR
jgi:hypothetical protein